MAPSNTYLVPPRPSTSAPSFLPRKRTRLRDLEIARRLSCPSYFCFYVLVTRKLPHLLLTEENPILFAWYLLPQGPEGGEQATEDGDAGFDGRTILHRTRRT